jgi:hypothetical protein
MDPFAFGMPRLARWALGRSKASQIVYCPLILPLMANRLHLALMTNQFAFGMLTLGRFSNHQSEAIKS